MKAELNDRMLRSLKAPEVGRMELSDTKRKGLRFRLSPSGQGVWMYEKRIKGGPKRKHTFGKWPGVSLSHARALALELEAEAAIGIDRVAVERKNRSDIEEAKAGLTTVQQVIDTYDRLHLTPNLRTAVERKKQLEHSLSNHLNKSISELTRKDLQEAVDAKAQEGRKIMANRLQSALSAFSKWSWRRGYTESNIGVNISKVTKETPRERVLSLNEMHQIWAASFDMGSLWGPLIRLLILTAQRLGNIAELRWSEVDFDREVIFINGSRTKNGKPQITHLSVTAISELIQLAECKGDSDFVFTTTGSTPVSGFSRVKDRLDKLLSEDFEPWRIHDFRTAFATALAESGEPEAVVDRILNHVASGSAPSAVARVYNQAQQLPQRAAVLNKWEGMIINPPMGTVNKNGVENDR